MSARPRDLLKTRAQRIGEVLTQVHLKNGNADSNIVVFGGNITAHSTPAQLAVSDTAAVIGQNLVDKAAASAIAVGSTSDTGVGQFRRTLIEMDATGAITFNPGAIAGSQPLAVAAAATPSADKVVLGVLDTGASFTGGTTTLAGKLIKEPYWSA